MWATLLQLSSGLKNPDNCRYYWTIILQMEYITTVGVSHNAV